MSNYEEDKAICDAAINVYEWLDGTSPCDEYVASKVPQIEEHIMHFNPSKVMAMLDELQAKDERIAELESGIVRITEIEDEPHGGDWDEIDHARNIARELLK